MQNTIAAVQPIIGIIVKFAVSWLRSNPSIPWLSEENKKKTLAVVGAVSALAGVISAILTGSLDEGIAQTFLDSIYLAIETFGTAVAFHEVTKDHIEPSEKTSGPTSTE